MSDLRCVHCGYELRGLALRRDVVRCPECGARTDLNTLAADLVAARRQRRRLDRDITVMLVLAFAVILATAALEGLPGADMFGGQVRAFLLGRGWPWAIVILLLLFVGSLTLWDGLGVAERVAFAGGVLILALVIPAPWSFLVVPAWIIGYHAGHAGPR